MRGRIPLYIVGEINSPDSLVVDKSYKNSRHDSEDSGPDYMERAGPVARAEISEQLHGECKPG